ncbi:MAG: TadE/TadG family type IV pilus assembly protein [Parvibaculaceae bacterium]
MKIRLQNILSAGRRFFIDPRGMVAVEFALIVPVMLVIYFGTVETTNAMTAARRVTNVTQTAADLTAQVTTVATSDLNDIFAASTAILTPFPTTGLKVTITSVTASASNANTTTVAWSKAYGGGTARSTGAAVTLPSGLTTVGSSVIMVETTYAYTSPIAQFITGTINMKEVAYLKPRRSTSVAFSG